mmetsp:Transcript_8552/g.7576  ORF Transcript_8552/g.7576 Transcript_8552/m.7576 type:complete len:309 (+) Transcript_8552:80-1006(+)
MMDYLLKAKMISARQLSLYKPSRSILKFMKKHYGLEKRLIESVECYTYFNILGSANDGDHKYDLYQKHLKFLEDKKKKPSFLEMPLFPEQKELNHSRSNFSKTGRQILDGGFTKSMVGGKEEKKIDPLSLYAFSKAKNTKSIFIKESLDELMKPYIQEQMGHDPDDLSQFIPGGRKIPDPSIEFLEHYKGFVPSDNAQYEPRQRTLRPIRTELPTDLTKSVIQNHGFSLGVTAKNKNELAQSLVLKKGLNTDVYKGKEVLAPLYQVELREINEMNQRYNASKVQELTLRQEMDRLAVKAKKAGVNRYS